MFDLGIFSTLGETRMICLSMTCIVLILNCCTCNNIITESAPSDTYCCVQCKMSIGLFIGLSTVSQLKCLQICVLPMHVCVPVSSHSGEATDGGTRCGE